MADRKGPSARRRVKNWACGERRERFAIDGRSNTRQCPTQGDREMVEFWEDRESSKRRKDRITTVGEGGRGGGDWLVGAAFSG